MHAIREECKMTDAKVKEMFHHYEECRKRVEAKGSGACSEYYYDFFYALDSCVRSAACVIWLDARIRCGSACLARQKYAHIV